MTRTTMTMAREAVTKMLPGHQEVEDEVEFGRTGSTARHFLNMRRRRTRMSRIRIAARLMLVAMVLVWPISSDVGLKATASNINQPHGGKPVSANKFVR